MESRELPSTDQREPNLATNHSDRQWYGLGILGITLVNRNDRDRFRRAATATRSGLGFNWCYDLVEWLTIQRTPNLSVKEPK